MAQFGAWSQFQPVIAVNHTDSIQISYPIRLIVDTEDLISQNKMETDGRDIRFGDSCATVVYAYWIEDYINTDSTVIWVRLDSIGIGDSLTFKMFYGNPAAQPNSSFNQTFPNAIVTNGNQTLTQGIPYRWIEVNAGDTLFLDNGVLNDIEARVVDIQGVVSGKGRGFQAPPNSNNGNGPGGGTWGSTSGAGGGGYGGIGGVGGYDANDPINAGGTTYGTQMGTDIAMGSTGGCPSVVLAGNGGGGLRLLSEFISIAGTIDCDGGLAEQPGAGQGGGGGSGGGILLHAENINLTGTLKANGNGGSIGAISANDDGGGGGGGRIKLFYGGNLLNSGTLAVNGGPGGVNGGAGQGEPGSTGTTHLDTLGFKIVTGSLGNEQVNVGVPAPPVISAPGGPVCGGDTINLELSGDFSSYTFSSGGNILQSGMDSTYTFLASTSATFEITSVGLCTYLDTVDLVVASFPDPQLTATPQTLCLGDSAFLIVANGFSNVVWSTGEVSQFIYVNLPGSYSVEVTDTNGCMNRDTVEISLFPPTLPFIIGTPGPPLCDGDTVVLSTNAPYTSYNWSTGDTTPTISLTTSLSVGVEVVDNNGCVEGAFATIIFHPVPNPSLSVNGNVISVNPAFASYQWFLNGNVISGANSQSLTATATGTYSVLVTSQDGCQALSDTTFLFVGLEPGALHPGLTVVPNPFTSEVSCSLSIVEPGDLEIEVVDLRGKVWREEREEVVTREWKGHLDLNELPQGIYLLRIRVGDHQYVKRLSKL